MTAFRILEHDDILIGGVAAVAVPFNLLAWALLIAVTLYMSQTMRGAELWQIVWVSFL